jgi:2-keto-4-pentenoate hydratase/2-oxohepta-3-ene-1,7-dioic acid hydratase in catechol pathway
MRLRVNDELRQEAPLCDMIFSFAKLLDFWSMLPLRAGNVVTSGTPARVALGHASADWFLKSGDTVTAGVDRIGDPTTFIT